MGNTQQYLRLLRDVRNYLEFHRRIGIAEYPLTETLRAFLRRQDAAGEKKPTLKIRQPAPPSAPTPVLPSTGEAQKPDAKPVLLNDTLTDIRNDLGECKRCPLCEERHAIIFGEGDDKARLVIVGDFPDRNDDREGKPFTGEIGGLLDRMLKAIGLSRQDVYCTNMVKCAPPSGRLPSAEEMACCFPFLSRQLKTIAPQLICSMGPLSSQGLTKSPKSLFRLRGQVYRHDNTALLPTFHPGYLLTHEEMKKPAWADIQMIQRLLK